jgi:peptidyl-prolyl cis-trans isomerase B (cyclophilin B)
MKKAIQLISAAALGVVLTAPLTGCGSKEISNANKPANADTTNQQNKEKKTMQVLLKTNKGDIKLELDADKAPITVENFTKYVQDGQYDGTIFHRVIKGFMVQGGGMNANMQEKKTRAPIVNEADNGLKNDKYTIAMARTSDPDSATAQFFINTNNNDFLNYKSSTMQGWGYAVFGKVIEGQEVVDAIEGVATTRKYPHDDVPVDAIVIEKAEIVK